MVFILQKAKGWINGDVAMIKICIPKRPSKRYKKMIEEGMEKSRKYGHVASVFKWNIFFPLDNELTFMAQPYIEEDHMISDILHLITEKTIFVTLMMMFPSLRTKWGKVNGISHLITSLSLYNGKKPIHLSEDFKIFKKLTKFLDDLKCKYTFT
jgi:hypothetical protein